MKNGGKMEEDSIQHNLDYSKQLERKYNEQIYSNFEKEIREIMIKDPSIRKIYIDTRTAQKFLGIPFKKTKTKIIAKRTWFGNKIKIKRK